MYAMYFDQTILRASPPTLPWHVPPILFLFHLFYKLLSQIIASCVCMGVGLLGPKEAIHLKKNTPSPSSHHLPMPP